MTAATLARDERSLRGGGGEESRTKHRNSGSPTAKKAAAEGACLNTAALTQLVGAAKSTGLARHLHPELLEGLDLALATIDPSKVTTQLILKAFEHVPGASEQLQQILGSNPQTTASLLAATLQPPLDTLLEGNGAGGKGTIAAGEYLVLQTPVLQATLTGDGKTTKQPGSAHQHKRSPFSTTTLSACQQGQQDTEAVGSSRDDGKSSRALVSDESEPDTSSPWETEHSALVAEVQSLRKHKDWADRKIDQLIRRVRDAEGPQRLLKEEVQQLRLEKDSVESKLKDFELSLQNLKDCTYTEAAQRREYELSLRNAQAELRGSCLREQEVQQHLREVQLALRQEKKRREALERQLKKTSDERSEAQASAAEVSSTLTSQAKELVDAKRALQEHLVQAKSVENILAATEQQAKAATKKAAELKLQLAACQDTARSRVGELEGVIAALTAQLDDAQSAVAAREESSLYSHFGGPALFEGSGHWDKNGGFAGFSAIESFALNLNGIQSVPATFGRGIPAESSAETVSRPIARTLPNSRNGVEVP